MLLFLVKGNQMTIEDRFRERHKSGDTPWDIGKPDFNLVEVVTQKPILSCKALDIGCGTGDNSIWLAQNGFEVTGTDTSDIALEKQKKKPLRPTLNAISFSPTFLTAKLRVLLLASRLTEAVFIHSVLKMTEKGLPEMSLHIWKKRACG